MSSFLYPSSHYLSTCLSSLSTEGDYLSVRGALAVAVKYMAAINVLAGWAIQWFPPWALLDRTPLPHLNLAPQSCVSIRLMQVVVDWLMDMKGENDGEKESE